MVRKKNELTLGEALKEFISSNRLQKGLDKVKVKEAWISLMGNGVNNYTTGLELRDGILYVSLSSSVLREELSLGKSRIISMLNEELGREVVTRIVLR